MVHSGCGSYIIFFAQCCATSEFQFYEPDGVCLGRLLVDNPLLNICVHGGNAERANNTIHARNSLRASSMFNCLSVQSPAVDIAVLI